MVHSGKKYLRKIGTVHNTGKSDVYNVIDAFNVKCPAVGHALKKLLCAGIRGKGNTLQDLSEARDAISRAIQLEEDRAVAARTYVPAAAVRDPKAPLTSGNT